MDAGLYNTLKQNGISDATLGVLLEEDVSTTHAFISLQKGALRQVSAETNSWTTCNHAESLEIAEW